MQANRPSLRQIITELRRRRVFRVAAVYAGAAFVTIQAADLLVPALGLPGWVYRLVVVLLLLGFPLAVALAWAFDITPEGVQRTASNPEARPDVAAGEAVAESRRGGPAWLRPGGGAAGLRRGGAVALLVLAVGGVWALTGRSGPMGAADPDEGLVAVFPFRTTGLDPALAYLGEGMVDLLAAKFTGTGGPRALDPQTALNAAQRRFGSAADAPRDGLLTLARSMGAGLVVLGSVVGTPAGVTVQASMHEVGAGRQLAAASVAGPADSLHVLVDRLSAALLSLSAGEAEQRLPSLTSTSPPALRAYLEGQAAVRRGAFADAGRHFATALEHDSTFVLAALARGMAIQWINDPNWFAALGRAWQLRDRLSPRDRILLEAYGGPELPEWSLLSDWIAAAERAAEALPDRAELWYWLADRLYHQGELVGWPDAHEQAVQHFRRAVALDSSLVEPVIHLLEIAAIDGDTAGVRTYSRLLLRADSLGDEALVQRWTAAAALGDSAALRTLRHQLPETPTPVLQRLLGASRVPNGPLDDGDAIAAELRRRGGTREERAQTLSTLGWYELIRGRPTRTSELLAERRRLMPDQSPAVAVNHALYWGGDRDAAHAALAELEARARGGAEDAARRSDALCALGQWHAWQHDAQLAAWYSGELRALLGALPDSAASDERDECVRVVEAIVLVQQRDGRASAAVEELAAYHAAGRLFSPLRRELPLILARLWDALDRPDRALAAIRRRDNVHYDYRPTLMLYEARLAAAAGERDAAVRLYRHYLRLHADAEPALHAERERVRAELAALLGERD